MNYLSFISYILAALVLIYTVVESILSICMSHQLIFNAEHLMRAGMIVGVSLVLIILAMVNLFKYGHFNPFFNKEKYFAQCKKDKEELIEYFQKLEERSKN